MKKIARLFEFDGFDLSVMAFVVLIIYSLASCVQ